MKYRQKLDKKELLFHIALVIFLLALIVALGTLAAMISVALTQNY